METRKRGVRVHCYGNKHGIEGYSWIYRGSAIMATCPTCHNRLTVKNAKKQRRD